MIIKSNSILILKIFISSIVFPIIIFIFLYIYNDFYYQYLQKSLLFLNKFIDMNLLSKISTIFTLVGISIFSWLRGKLIIKIIFNICTLYIPNLFSNFFIKNTLKILDYNSEDINIEPENNNLHSFLSFIFYMLNFNKYNIKIKKNYYIIFAKFNLTNHLNNNKQISLRCYSKDILFYIGENKK